MMQRTKDGSRMVLSLIALAAVTACGGGRSGSPEEWDFRDSDGPPRGGGWYINNGVFQPDVTMFDPGHSLAGGEGIDPAQLDTDERVKAAQYAIECALSDAQSVTVSIDGEPTVFEGALGLAPEWLSGACDGECQEWVSACLLARTNVTGIAGVEVVLWIDDPDSSDEPDPEYTYEASFFGNLFAASNGYLCQEVTGLVSSVTAARVCSVTTGCLIPLTNRYVLCDGALLIPPRCSDEPGTPHHQDCKAGLVPAGSQFNTINTYIRPDVVDLLADLLGL